MYRLPSQFDPEGRQDDLAAAGGGSTSTTCSSCCLVTFGGASIATAVIFANAEPSEFVRATSTTNLSAAPTGGETPAQTDSTDDTPHASQGSDSAPVLFAKPPLSKGLRMTLGALALLLAGIASALVGAIAFPLAIFIFIAVYIGLFCIVYERSGLSALKGSGIGVLMLIAITVCAALEMYVWLQIFF